MAKRIEIIGKSLVVTDTVSSDVLLDVPKSDYYYNIKRLVDNGLIVFYNLDFKDNLKSSPDPIYLSEAVDSTDTAFDEAGFIAFCRANLGFRFGEGDVTVNPLTLYPVENEYLDINSVGELLDDQVNQTENFFQYVIDATDDGRVTSVDGDAYYQKLSTSTGSLGDYRLLTDSEVLVLQNSNSWRIFRISAINNDATPLTTVPNTRVGVDYNVGTDYVTAFLFDRFFSDTIENISTASNMSIQVYNQNTDVIYLATIDSFDIVGQYLRANVTSTIDKDSWSVNHRLEFVFDSSGGGAEVSSLTLDVNQVAHGLSVGEAIKYNGTIYSKAQADTSANSDTIGVVSVVTDVDNFTFQYLGIVTTGVWVDGTHYFLSPSVAGAIIAEPVYAIGEVRQYIGQGIPEGLLLNINIGDEIESGYDVLEEDSTVTGTKNIDWNIDTFYFTMTGDTTFTDINLPVQGSKVITLHITGNFTPTYPSGWTTYINGVYDGLVLNLIVVEYVKAVTPFFKVQITQPD